MMRTFVVCSLLIALAGCGGSDPVATSEGSSATAQSDPAAETLSLDDYGYIGGVEAKPMAMPGWVPETLYLPDDFVAVGEQTLMPGRSVLLGLTKEPEETLFDSLAKGLQEAGFEVRDSEYYRSEKLVYFGGNGYEDSTIRIRPGKDDTLLEIGLVEKPK